MDYKKIQLFDGTNYAFWSKRMKSQLISLGFDVWESVVNGYTIPKNPPTDLKERKEGKYNAKYFNSILCALKETEFVKVMNYNTTKEIWDKLKNVYQGNSGVQK